MVRSGTEDISEWTSEGKQKRHSLSMGDGVWLSVIKGLHMIVCVSGCVKASSRVVPQDCIFILSQQEIAGTGFFVFCKHRDVQFEQIRISEEKQKQTKKGTPP